LKPELKIDLPLPSTPPAVLATLREIMQQIREAEGASRAKSAKAKD
jgi:hypothetical protein